MQNYLDGNCPQPGNYLLKDGSCSVKPVYDQESGIYFTPNHYIDLVALSNCPKRLSAAEAKLWCKMNDYTLPSAKDLERIAPVLKAINGALCDVDMTELLLPADYLQEFWDADSVRQSQDNDEKRLLILGYKANVPEIVIFMGELKKFFHD